MQAEAIFEAALDVGNVIPEVMIPLVGTVAELKNQKEIVVRSRTRSCKRRGKLSNGRDDDRVPRAALVADEIAEEAGSSRSAWYDLTQMTFGLARRRRQVPPALCGQEDPADRPFVSIDQVGVGGLVKGAVEKGQRCDGMKIGVCGERRRQIRIQ
jgi:pyruvate,orthophosphate dikinase